METLERLFPETPHLLTETPDAAPEDVNPTISVFMLGGDSTVFEYQPGMTVKDLKLLVKERLGTSPEKQRLLFKDQELKSFADSKFTTLQDYNIQPFSTLYLIVLLYAIPDSFDHVTFDLFWGYPTKGRDYLDASVLIYSGNQFQKIADYRGQQCFSGAVYHSGDVMDDGKNLGHHTINVKLKSLPPYIDKLFFTLSAWSSPNISKYKNPSLRFFEAKEPTKQLCSDHMQKAAYSQAIIMCGLSKIDGAWNVFRLSTLSAGNAENYTPLKQTISRIISERFC